MWNNFAKIKVCEFKIVINKKNVKGCSNASKIVSLKHKYFLE